jgi:predicted Mrr-cat superfamily restriction endonuclease
VPPRKHKVRRWHVIKERILVAVKQEEEVSSEKEVMKQMGTNIRSAYCLRRQRKKRFKNIGTFFPIHSFF